MKRFYIVFKGGLWEVYDEETNNWLQCTYSFNDAVAYIASRTGRAVRIGVIS